MTTVEKQIRRFLVENFLYDGQEDDLAADASFLEGGIIDSTGVLELELFLEETFGIEVADEDVLPENFDSIRRLVEYTTRKLQLAAENGGSWKADSMSQASELLKEVVVWEPTGQ